MRPLITTISIKRFLKRNLADVGMTQCMTALAAEYINKKCHAHSDMHSIAWHSIAFHEWVMYQWVSEWVMYEWVSDVWVSEWVSEWVGHLRKTFPHDHWKLRTEMCNASTTHYYLKMKMVNFGLEALLSSYDIICSSWQSLSATKSPVKSKLYTTSNYLSPWKVHLYHKSATLAKYCLEQLRPRHSAYVLIVLLSLLCT